MTIPIEIGMDHSKQVESLDRAMEKLVGAVDSVRCDKLVNCLGEYIIEKMLNPPRLDECPLASFGVEWGNNPSRFEASRGRAPVCTRVFRVSWRRQRRIEALMHRTGVTQKPLGRRSATRKNIGKL